MKKKIRELTPQEMQKLNKVLEECNIITFDENKIKGKILKANQLKDKAHIMLDQSEKLIAEVLKEIL